EEDFYMVYLQTADRDDAPRLQNYKDEFTDRSWEMYKEFWYPLESNCLTGNKMIRADVEYEVGKAEITSPENGSLTNEAEITLEGTDAPNTTVEVLQNGEVTHSVEIGDDGNFMMDTILEEGENEFVGVTYVDGEEANESDLFTITLDTLAPILTIESPEDND